MSQIDAAMQLRHIVCYTFVAAFATLTALPAPAQSLFSNFFSAPVPTPVRKPEAVKIAAHQHHLSRQALAPHLWLGFNGRHADDKAFKRFLREVELGYVGGALFLGRNVGRDDEDVRSITTALTQAGPRSGFAISVDQEGGRVQRLKPWHGVPDVPSAQALSQLSPEAAEVAYTTAAAALKDLGFTHNFGPVTDVALDPANPVIAGLERSYGRDPQQVVTFARTFIRAHRGCGVTTALKHFPGHGSAAADSHLTLPDITAVWREASELAPYKALRGDVDMVMVAHLKHDYISALPSSLSPEWIGGYLREEIGYTGVAITDDLDMASIAANYSPAEAVVMALQAGVDIALHSNSRDGNPVLAREILDAVIEARAAGADLQVHLNQSVSRIIAHRSVNKAWNESAEAGKHVCDAEALKEGYQAAGKF